MKNAEEDLALNDLFGLEIGLESQTIWCICKMNESDFDLVENDSFISNSNSSEDKEEEAFEVYLLSQPIQCLAISFIIIVAIVCNSLVIHNICMCQVSLWYYTRNRARTHCLQIPQNVAFEVLNFGIFHQFLSYLNWPVW